MNQRQLVRDVIKGQNTKTTPVYGWVFRNLKEELIKEFGSVENFEDYYNFDMAHIFGGPRPYDNKELDKLRKDGIEITPELVLDMSLKPADNMEDYIKVIDSLEFYQKDRQRFCYIQTPGIFEFINSVFGIEEHLCNMALYPEQMKEIYKRQAEWNRQYVDCMIDLGVDMIHVSDDWGAQTSLLFSKDMWKELIYPNHKIVCDRVKQRDTFLSLHSDGNVAAVLDGIVDLGYDVVHPWQESAGMSYDLYLDKYSDKLAILGGLCIQTTLGFGDYEKLESEIRRVFNTLKGKRWIFCTTHFVQDHCSIDELTFAYDLAVKLARD